MNFIEKMIQLFNKFPIPTLFALLLIGVLGYLKGSITLSQTLIYMGLVVLSVFFTEVYRKFKNRKRKA